MQMAAAQHFFFLFLFAKHFNDTLSVTQHTELNTFSARAHNKEAKLRTQGPLGKNCKKHGWGKQETSSGVDCRHIKYKIVVSD